MSCDIILQILRRTFEVWAAHFLVTLTPNWADTSAHFMIVLPGDTGVRAGDMGLGTNILTILE